MKKFIMYLVLACAIFLVGCNKEASLPNLDADSNNPKAVEQKRVATEVLDYSMKTEDLHSIVGFLSETTILYVAYESESFHLVTYNLITGEKEKIYSEKDQIIQVMIHPSKKQIIVQSSEHSSSATVKMISLKGKILHSVDIQSSELSIMWNPNNPQLVAFTAFQGDFSYQCYVFDGEQEKLHKINPSNPFLVWQSEDILLYNRWTARQLNGGKIVQLNWKTGREQQTDLKKVVYLDAEKDARLTVQIDFETEQFSYLLKNKNKEITWQAPALSNYSQWFVPDLVWLEDQSVIAIIPTEGGLLDNYSGKFKLMKISEEKVEELITLDEYTMISCSPKGSLCLYGNDLEQVMSFEPYKKKKWLTLE
ncbi:YqgU-like beta propeller domain-containing protein [Viridibacillus arvi]|uniref:YqgU-like beta propeller domain-containing protein n=1 Tax=Viridibacillus arvi TaxID=263475 RepID=UPI0034CD8E35